MALEQAPVVPGFSVPGPDFRTQSDEEFNERCQVWVDEQPPFHAGLVDMGAWIKNAADYVDNAAAGADLSSQDAADFAAVASASANFKGRWSALTGSLAIPASVAHTVNDQDKLWMLLENVPNVAAEQPGVSSKWLDLSAQGGLQLVSGPTDVRPGRAVNPTWDFFRAAFSANAIDMRGTSASVDIVNSGNFPLGSLCLADSTNGVMPGPGTWSISTVNLSVGSWRAQFAMHLYSSSAQDEGYYFRTGGGDVFTGRPWLPLHGGGGGGGGGGSSPDGPIKTLVQNFSSENQVSNNIAITIDCSEHTSFVVNAQNAPFPNASGAYNITISNLPEPGEGLFIGRIRARNLGRKAVNFILPAGLTASWLATPQFSTANTAGATTWDWIEFFRSPDQPNIIYFDQVNGR